MALTHAGSSTGPQESYLRIRLSLSLSCTPLAEGSEPRALEQDRERRRHMDPNGHSKTCLHYRALISDAVGPEMGDAELSWDDRRTAKDERSSDTHHSSA